MSLTSVNNVLCIKKDIPFKTNFEHSVQSKKQGHRQGGRSTVPPILWPSVQRIFVGRVNEKVCPFCSIIETFLRQF